MSYFKWNGNYKAIVSPNGESILMVYGRRIGGSERESTSLESLCVQLDEERDKYKKALEEISTLKPSSYGDFPVKLTDSEMFHIAKRAIE